MLEKGSRYTTVTQTWTCHQYICQRYICQQPAFSPHFSFVFILMPTSVCVLPCLPAHLRSLPALAACVTGNITAGHGVPHLRRAGRLWIFAPKFSAQGKPKSRLLVVFPVALDFSAALHLSSLLFFSFFSTGTLHPTTRSNFSPVARSSTPNSPPNKMAGERMDVDREVAEKQLKSLDHSEQHYFNRQVLSRPCSLYTRTPMLTICAAATTTMVSGILRLLMSNPSKSWLTVDRCDPAIRHPRGNAGVYIPHPAAPPPTPPPTETRPADMRLRFRRKTRSARGRT